MKNSGNNPPPLRANKLLQPTLFDRLFDDNPQAKKEEINQFSVNKEELKKIIQRDISYLFNTINKANDIDEEIYQEAYNSTLNYGIPPLSGQFNTGFSWDRIKEQLLSAIHTFEPRIIPDSIEITPNNKGGNLLEYNTLAFSISGQVYSLPYPIDFLIQSMVDLETSYLQIKKIHMR